MKNNLIVLLFILIFSGNLKSQNILMSKNSAINLPNYDEAWIHFGFLIGLHSSYYRINYSEKYASPEFSDLHSIVPLSKPGFKLGFISDINIIYPFDLRTLLQVSFYEFSLEYKYLSGDVFSDTRAATLVELPILVKYKSQRRKNLRMYIISGFKPGIEVGAKNKDEAGKDILGLKAYDISFELGFGADIFFELFKLSPEIRYSRGLINMIKKSENGVTNIYSDPIEKIIPHNLSIFFTFEGGPN